MPNAAKVFSDELKIEKRAIPGVLSQKRREIERQLPNTRLTREISMIDVTRQNEIAFGDKSTESLKLEKERKIQGLKLIKELGPDSLLVDDKGMPNFFGRAYEAIRPDFDLPGATEFNKGRRRRLEVDRDLETLGIRQGGGGASREVALEENTKSNREVTEALRQLSQKTQDNTQAKDSGRGGGAELPPLPSGDGGGGVSFFGLGPDVAPPFGLHGES